MNLSAFAKAGFQQDFIGTLRGNWMKDLFHSLNVAGVSPWYFTLCLSKYVLRFGATSASCASVAPSHDNNPLGKWQTFHPFTD